MISQSESRSLEVPFFKGLNIITGGNKTGKSSIIKSIFTTFGCECKRVEKEWKDIISTYILHFQYAMENYCIVREKKKFQLFQQNQNEYEYSCLLETEAFHEYSNMLMQLFEVNMPCVSKDGKTFNITPPLLFRFQYIDQDEGWNKIADSFDKISYIKDWKKNTNKYICGYLNEDYYSLRAKSSQLTFEKDELKKEFIYNQNFVTQISTSLKYAKNMENPEKLAAELAEFIDAAEIIRNQQFDLKAKMSAIENDIFVNEHKLRMATSSLQETHQDIDFAMNQDDELICPTCGARYRNGLTEQLNVSSDSALAEKLAISLTKELTMLTDELSEYMKQYELLSQELPEIDHNIQKSKQLLSYSSFYKNEGKQELYESCLQQLKLLQTKLDLQIASIAKLNEQVNDLKSRTRSKEIRKQIEGYCIKVADLIAIPKTFIKLRDFVQVLEKTGSETPRLVYMYQTALYLYNLNRAVSPFNFFVIDTPNQQGQDDTNLKNIYQSINLFLSTDGQVILGTERETGCEDKASMVLRLTEKRRCLTQENFSEHLNLLEALQKEAIRWVHNERQNKIQ